MRSHQSLAVAIENLISKSKSKAEYRPVDKVFDEFVNCIVVTGVTFC